MMNRDARRGTSRLVCAVLAAGLAARPLAANDATVEMLTAPRVRSYVRITTDSPPILRLDGVGFEYTEPLSVVANNKLAFVVANYNPLTMEVKLDAAEADDPSVAALDKFLSAVLGSFKPSGSARLSDATGPSPVTPGCSAAAQVRAKVIDFDAVMKSGALSTSEVKAWADGAVGRVGIGKQADDIGVKGGTLTENATIARKRLGEIEALRQQLASALPSDASIASAEQGIETARSAVRDARAIRDAEQTRLEAARTRHQKEKARDAQSDATRKAATALGQAEGARERADRVLRGAEDHLKAAQDARDCTSEALALLAVFSRTQPAEQIDRLARLGKAATDLAAVLHKVAQDDDAWFPPVTGPFGSLEANRTSRDHVVDSKGPRPGKVVTVTVVAKKTTLSSTDSSIDRSVVPKSESKAVVRMRERSLFAYEIGAGLVVAGVRTPTYGAVKNDAGQTVVAKTKVQQRDFKGALMLNMPCRCWNDTFLFPMLQFGVAADETAPALFFGGGFRFIRPKGLGFSGGAVLAWVKDLDKLGIGGAIESQAVIDADLKAQPTVKPYFALHYSF